MPLTHNTYSTCIGTYTDPESNLSVNVTREGVDKRLQFSLNKYVLFLCILQNKKLNIIIYTARA